MLNVEIGLVVLFALAFGNGANDVGKSVAALMMDPDTAAFKPRYSPLIWGGLFSGLGSILAIIISVRLFSAFTPQSFFQTTPGVSFILAALVGAASWILIATLLRVQVSTTHAIVGAIIVQAIYLLGASSLEWTFLIWRILLPLAAGPFVALIGVYIISSLLRKRDTGLDEDSSSKRLGAADWISAAGVAFARGVNDAPKMAALGAFLLLGTSEDGVLLPYIIVGVAVVAGSLVWGDRVAKTLIGHTPLQRGHRLKAHGATAVLVSAGSYFGDAFSTTNVSEGATAGHHGKKGRQFLGSALRGMALAWMVTLPAAGLLAIAASILGARFWG
ncbi:hypothetical protein E6H34_04880 [Candidatus Bathyarchaeota archaeon]|nr:MAG: hypothetical protein E6H34_04880 [Candidatus Bathyarchaeota archaeon]